MTTILSDGESPTLDDLTTLERLQHPSLVGAFDKIGALPSPPVSLVQLNEILSREDFCLDEVVSVVGSDVATAARLLRLANSAFFGLAEPVSDLRAAVTFLGVTAVRNLVVAGDALAGFRESSAVVRRARAAVSYHGAAVAEVACGVFTDRARASEVYAGGLLHDIGVLLLAEAFPDDEPEGLLESDGLAITHAEAGAYLLHHWGLPTSIIEIVLYHHDAPRRCEGHLDAVQATHVADALVRERCPGAAWWEEPTSGLDDDYVAGLGLTELVTGWREDSRTPL